MKMSFTDDTYIKQVQISVIGKLKCLDTNDAYKKVVAALDDANLDRPPLDWDFVDDLDNAFKKQRSPTAILLQELGQKGYRVSDLKRCFRLSEQIRALVILEGGDTTTGLIEGREVSPGRRRRGRQPLFYCSHLVNNRARQLPSYNPPQQQQPQIQLITSSRGGRLRPQELHERTIVVPAASLRHGVDMFPASDSDGGDTTTGLIEGRGVSPGRPLRDRQPHFNRSQLDNNRARQLPLYYPSPQPPFYPTTPTVPQERHGRTIEVSATSLRHSVDMFPASDSDDERADESQKAGAQEAIDLSQPGGMIKSVQVEDHQPSAQEGTAQLQWNSDNPLLPDGPSPPSHSSPPTWMEQYMKVIDQRGFVTLHITRCVLIGPPRVGKSSLKLLLINNEPPDQCVEKSTDLMEAPVVLTRIEGKEEKGSQWKELTLNNLQQLVSKCTREEGYDPAQPNISTAVALDTDNVSSTVAESSNTSKPLVDSELERRYHDFVEATMSEKSLAELKMNGLKMVHVFDCGGQLAFQDTIPLLINAPCAFISVFNASVDLDEEVELRYCPEKGKELSLGHKESQWNMLCRIFSSIHSLQFKCHEYISNLIEGQTVPSSPIAVVGTHKDVLRESSKKDGGLKRTEKKINERLDQLRESKLYDFVREKGCTLDLVANRSKDDFTDHDINSLRKDIERKATLPLKLPLSWIILELFTRKCLLENKFISFHDLHQLCIRKSIVSCKEEFSSLLQVLHVLGFYAFYQLDGVPDDQNWVCTDAATLYSEVTKMLMVQYKEKFRKGATAELKTFGRIKLNKAALHDLFTDLEINIGEAEPMWFIKVLLHIGLAAKVEGEEEEEVFFPLALPFKRSDLPPVTSVATICFTLEFPSGASEGRVHANITEIPRGIYPRLIVHLLSQQRLGVREWKVCKGDSCSWIKLIHCSYKYVIYLNEHVDHIELALVLNDTFLHTPCNSKATNRVGTLCQELRKHLVSALGATFVLVFGEQPPERKSPSIVYGLRCSVCRDSSHMAIVRPTDESTPQDPQYTENCVHKKLPKTVVNPDQLIWFSPMEEVTFDKETHQIQDGEWKIWVMKGTGTLKPEAVVESVSDLMPYYMDMTAHLFELAAALGVLPLSRAVIDGNGTPQSKCLQILSHWLETTPRPSWSLLCQKLKLVPSFNAVVLKISKDHHLSTAGDLEPATPIAKRMRLANTGRLPDNTSSAGSNSRSKPYCQY